jgi:secreted PhoX family phosphatase
MQVSCVNNNQQYGQGCEIGNAAWVMVNAATARSDANAAGATGYYRPEDLHQDPMYQDEANPEAVRFCWANTGNEGAKNYAEAVCGVDSAPLTASNTQRTVVVNRFVEGDTDFNSFDNLAFQPGTGNLYVIEDHNNGDIFACLPDGMDRDIKTDGCVKMLSVKDSSAEPTGFLFDASGRTAYVSIQHSDDTNMPLVDGYRSDDVLKITGFKVKKQGWGW